MEHTFGITVIIPAYNAELMIVDALASILAQDCPDGMEIIIIDDGSKDKTGAIVREYLKDKGIPPIKVQYIKQAVNQGQGVARNLGIQMASGRYIFFLDADDMLAHGALADMYEQAIHHKADIVACDWILFYSEHCLDYVNTESYHGVSTLTGADCERLLEARAYYSVNKLYGREFLLEHQIRYGEGYIYEDFEFFVHSLQQAETIVMLPNPYYRVRVNPYSTTKTQRDSMVHLTSLLRAVQASMRIFAPRSNLSWFYVHRYFLRKAIEYSKTRAPKGHTARVVKEVLIAFGRTPRKYKLPPHATLLERILFGCGVVRLKRVWLILLLHRLNRATRNFSLRSFLRNQSKTTISTALPESSGIQLSAHKSAKDSKEASDAPTILFLGFDFKYKGNSKYLFDYLCKSNPGYELRYATDDMAVDAAYRIAPRSAAFNAALARAKTVVAESWIPIQMLKQPNSIWVQLWHGTPYKRIFFDSHEGLLATRDPDRKKRLHRDIQRWDYLLADSPLCAEKLASAFAFQPERILAVGYPRVQWLRENQDNDGLKKNVRQRLDIAQGVKIVLYAPTWRDYNHKQGQQDMSYLLDADRLEQILGKEYRVLSIDHFFGSRANVRDRLPEMQEVLLVSSAVVTDYSSIVFDALSIDLPIYIYATDYDRYQAVRGVYKDIHSLLRPFLVDDVETLARRLSSDPDYEYLRLYQKAKTACCLPKHRSCEELQSLLAKLMNPSFRLPFITGKLGHMVQTVRERMSNGAKNVYLFGAGSGGMGTAQQLHGAGIAIRAFVDNDRRKHGKTLCGLPIMEATDLPSSQETLVVVASMWREEIITQLNSLGFDPRQIIAAY